jgi:hypothetical protein
VLSNIIGIASCDWSLAVDSNGYVWEWYNSNSATKVAGGQMGTTYLQNIAEVSAGSDKSTARTRDGFVLVWQFGGNPEYVTDGQMQTPSGLLEGIISINRGYYDFELAIDTNGRGWGWGDNDYGQLGVGDTTYRTEPALMSCAAVSDSNGIIYVDKDAVGGLNNGMSWDNAYLDFNDALPEAEIYAQALGECEIWVAAGTYKPHYQGTNYQWATFQMRPGNIAIRGHFGGKGVYETSPNQRNFNNDVNETIFDGLVGPSGQKAYYIVTCDNIRGGLLLDGFTFTNGANRGLYINNYSDPSITRCKFKGNGVYGIYTNNFCNPDITDSIFLENSVSGSGTGLYSYYSSWPYVKNCVFDGNNSSNSTSFSSNSSRMFIEDCNIRRYTSYGIYCSGNSDITITGCIVENVAGNGINCADTSVVEITDCTLQNNTNNAINCSNADTTISNCTIQGNSNSGIVASYLSILTITENIIFNNSNNGIYTEYCDSIIIKNNWIYHNGTSGDNSGIKLQYSISSPFVRNNTVIGNARYGVYVYYGQDPCLINDIIWQNGDSPPKNIYSERGLSGVFAAYCDIEGGFFGTGNISNDPCFVNPAAYDYHLRPASLCIDAGDPYADYSGETDIDGFPRVMLGRSSMQADIGAVEYLKADFNGDLLVNFVDFAALASKWRMTDPNKSLDEDSDVDIYDLVQFCDKWLWISHLSPLYEMLSEQSEGDSGMAAGTEESIESVDQSLTSETFVESVTDTTSVSEEASEGISEPVSNEQIQFLIDWVEQIWKDPEIQEAIDPNDYHRMINSLYEELND